MGGWRKPKLRGTAIMFLVALLCAAWAAVEAALHYFLQLHVSPNSYANAQLTLAVYAAYFARRLWVDLQWERYREGRKNG